jgi:hypothetical protein
MLTIYFGLVTVTHGYAVKERVQLASRTLSDLTGRLRTGIMNNAEVDNISTATAAIMVPYDLEGMVVTVASVVVRQQGGSVEGRVCWSASRVLRNGVPTEVAPGPNLAPNTVVIVPEGYRQGGSSYVVTEVKHVYRPAVGHAISGDVNFRDEIPWPVRNVQQIAWEGQPTCPATPL